MATSTVARFHRWIGTGDTTSVSVPCLPPADLSVDQCLGCGVTAPDCGDDHGTLPIGCPGPDVATPHRFAPLRTWSTSWVNADGSVGTAGGWTLYCEACGQRITETTTPDSVAWECAQ